MCNVTLMPKRSDPAVQAFIAADADTRREAMSRGNQDAALADSIVRCRAEGKPEFFTDPTIYRILDGIMASRAEKG